MRSYLKSCNKFNDENFETELKVVFKMTKNNHSNKNSTVHFYVTWVKRQKDTEKRKNGL
jgi:hypothetical protein